MIKYTKELLHQVISESRSWSQALEKLGRRQAGGNQTHLKKRCADFGIDTSHLLGQAWNRGRVYGSKFPIEEYLKENRPTKSHHLKLRLIKEGLKEHRCEVCGLNEWSGKPIPIELDHVNGNHYDNRLSNLRIICPNCHAQTETHAGKNKKRML